MENFLFPFWWHPFDPDPPLYPHNKPFDTNGRDLLPQKRLSFLLQKEIKIACLALFPHPEVNQTFFSQELAPYFGVRAGFLPAKEDNLSLSLVLVRDIGGCLKDPFPFLENRETSPIFPACC